MIIYTNGDSFVAGAGLALDIIPDCPGDQPEMTPKRRQELWNWNNYVRSNPKYEHLHKKMSILEKGRAFPALLKSKINGCFLLDASLGGCSFDRIARTTLTDLIGLRKRDPNRPIVAIIGNTDHYRKEIACSSFINRPWFDLHLAFADQLPNEPRDLAVVGRYFVREDTSYHRLIEYYKNWLAIKDFCKNNNIRLLFLRVVDNDFEGDNKPQDLAFIEEYVNLVPAVDMRLVARTFEKMYCPDGGHFSRQVHEAVAEEFMKLIV